MTYELKLLLEYSELVSEGFCESEADSCEEFSFPFKVKETMSKVEEREEGLVSFSDVKG